MFDRFRSRGIALSPGATGHPFPGSLTRTGRWVGAALLLAAPARAQYSVSPVIVPFSASDTARTVTLTIHNEGTEPLQIRLYAMDFDQSETGDHRYDAPGRHPRSCAARLRIVPDLVSVAPGDLQFVGLSLSPGAGDELTCWSMVFAEAPARTRRGIYLNERIGVKVYGLAAGEHPDGRVEGAEIHPGERGGETLSFAFDNTGGSPLRPSGTVELRTYAGTVVRSIPVRAFSVLPEHRRDVQVAIADGLPSGRYLAIPILDFGADYLAGAQVDFRVP